MKRIVSTVLLAMLCACASVDEDPDLAACAAECSDLGYEHAAFCGWDTSVEPPRRICWCWDGQRTSPLCLLHPSP